MNTKTIPIVAAPEEPVRVDPALLAPRLEFNRRTAKVAMQYHKVRNGKNEAPLSLQVALTDRCFNRCIMCDHPLREPREIPADLWLSWLSRRAGVESVCYSGGDPMAYREFNRVMRWHIEDSCGVAFGATITGFIPKTIDMELLKHAAWVRVSLDAVTPAVYDVVRGHTPVAKVLDGIEAMITAGVHVGLGITVHKQNEDDLPNVLAWAKERGIDDIDVRPVYPDSKLREMTPDRNIMAFNRCSAALFQLYIDADGAVYPCCITAGDTKAGPTAAALGNIREPWLPVWDRVVAFSRKKVADLPEVCRTCCVQRLSEINHICDAADAMARKPVFF